jgi:hypothetical protein
VQEYLGVPESWPVVEKIAHGIVLFPNAQDIRRAKKSDPRCCALHNAACRMMDIPNCAIGAHYAYIVQRDPKGRPFIARMQATRATQAAIRQFDLTGDMPAGGFAFVPIPPSDHLEHKRQYSRAYAANKPPRSRENAAAASRKYRAAKKANPSRAGRRIGTRAIPRTFTENEVN